MRSKNLKSRDRAVRGSVWSVVVALAVVVLVCLGVLNGREGEGLRKRVHTWTQGGAGTVVLSEDSAGYLAALSVENHKPRDAYHRESFGRAWSDEDHNGCDTRNDILARDLARVTFRDRRLCVVEKGTLEDPYTGQPIEFIAGKESRKVQIDHVVALSNAWASGASEWTNEKRRTFANDPDNLLAVDGRANEDKGGSDASRWLPPRREFHCPYVTRQLKIKARYSLSVTPEEKQAILKVLGDCPEYRLSAFVVTEHDHASSRKVLEPVVRPAVYKAQRHRRHILAQWMHGKLVRVQTADHVGVRRDDAEPRMFPQQQQHSAQIRVCEGRIESDAGVAERCAFRFRSQIPVRRALHHGEIGQVRRTDGLGFGEVSGIADDRQPFGKYYFFREIWVGRADPGEPRVDTAGYQRPVDIERSGVSHFDVEVS